MPSWPRLALLGSTALLTAAVFGTLMSLGGPPVAVRAAGGTTYYVSLISGSDGNTGASPSEAWQTVGKVNSVSLSPDDVVLFERGSAWDEDLTINSDGAPGSPITISSYGSGTPPVLRRLTTYGNYTVFENLTIDHQRIDSDTVRVRARQVSLRQMTIRNGGADGVDGSDADGLLIEDSHIHHFLAGSFTNQADAHGVVATDIQGLTILRTEIHHVSGDSFQADPSRSPNVPSDIVIEDSHFWTGPLTEDFNAWNAGEVPGENAIDTKVADDGDWPGAERATFTIHNLVAHGWINDGYISNRAVFNMKEKISAEFDGVTVYDAEIGFRIRGTRGNADVTIKNVVFFDLEKSIRAEDDLQNLEVYNSTFGSGIGELIELAGGGGGVGTWTFENNAFLNNSPPAEAPAPTNRSAQPADFIDTTTHDYHLVATSELVDAGAALGEVLTDREGLSRPQGDGHDIGAYEFLPEVVLTGHPADQSIHVSWSVNITLPVTSTWRLRYDSASAGNGTVLGIPHPTRAYSLTGLVNYTPYTVTLNSMLDTTPWLTDTVVVIPTDIHLWLPVISR